jgi:hypothetical protein
MSDHFCVDAKRILSLGDHSSTLIRRYAPPSPAVQEKENTSIYTCKRIELPSLLGEKATLPVRCMYWVKKGRG